MPRPLAVVVLLAWSLSAKAAPEGRVRQAASATYIHGMTAEIAAAEVGPEGLPELLALLEDPSFARRDNVVAFLAYLGGPESTAALVRLLENPSATGGAPEEERALVLVPHALGRIAGRGEPNALEALLAITAPGARGGLLASASARDAYTPTMRATLLEASVAALALTGSARARERLLAIAERRVVPDDESPWLSSRAREALALMEELEAGGAPGRASASGASSPGTSAPETSTPQAALPSPAVVYVPDPSVRSHSHGLSFVNHVSLSSPMTTSRLDSVLQEASTRAATGNYDGDVPCCVRAARSGAGGSFGTLGDGLDSIDGAGDQNSVLAVSSGRIKVVKAINYCSGAGTNIIGCASTPGNSLFLVRVSSLGVEAVLWFHEYGHNLGLDHSSDSRDFLFASDNGNNSGLLADECQAFHTPSGAASASMTDIGECNNDGDPLADPIDNCPLVSNEGQTDTDHDGIGDACEACADGDSDGDCDVADNCPTIANSNQADADGDGIGNVCDLCPTDPLNDPDGDSVCTAVDNCPASANPSQADFDADGFGDACETGALRADVNLSGRVDGFDLARIGRAFAAVTGDARYDADVDLDRNGQVDGSDLSLFAPQFGKKSF